MTVLFKLKCERICKTMCGEQVCMKTEAQLCTSVLLVLAVIVSNLFAFYFFNKEFIIITWFVSHHLSIYCAHHPPPLPNRKP